MELLLLLLFILKSYKAKYYNKYHLIPLSHCFFLFPSLSLFISSFPSFTRCIQLSRQAVRVKAADRELAVTECSCPLYNDSYSVPARLTGRGLFSGGGPQSLFLLHLLPLCHQGPLGRQQSYTPRQLNWEIRHFTSQLSLTEQ